MGSKARGDDGRNGEYSLGNGEDVSSEISLGDKPPIDYDNLPDNTLIRRRELEARGAPSEDRPRLDPEYEAMLEAIEEKHRACYIDSEEIAFRCRRLAKAIRETVPGPPRRVISGES